jgi:precorrin-4/cobalt-precorrin-4 C11-methyltransferase
MIHFVGAGCGAPDLITLRGKALIEHADVIIYAGSLVNPELLAWKKESCAVHDSAGMTLEEVMETILASEKKGLDTVRLHTGDPCLYGAIREQMDLLDEKGIAYDYCPGVSSFCGAAAALKMEYTLPGVSQSVVITRMAGRTPVPERESLRSFAAHHATMVLFLSTGLLESAAAELMAGGCEPDTPVAIVCRASWPDEKTFLCTVRTMAACAWENQITKTALIIVGDAVKQSDYQRSELYHPDFSTGYRQARR